MHFLLQRHLYKMQILRYDSKSLALEPSFPLLIQYYTCIHNDTRRQYLSTRASSA